VLCFTTTGAWVVLGRRPGETIPAFAAITQVNEMLAPLPAPPDEATKTVRLVADVPALIRCLEGLAKNPACQPSPPGDLQHSLSLPGDRGAVSAVDMLEPLCLYSARLVDLLLPNFMRELFLTDEMASVAIEKGRPKIACLAYGEAFRIDPYLAYQHRPRERFEMAALMAGDTEVPQFRIAASDLFADSVDTSRLRPLPEIAHGFELLVSFPVEDGHRIEASAIAVRANPGYAPHRQLLHFVNLQILGAHRELLDSPDTRFFARAAQQLVAAWWIKADRKQRLELDLEALRRFGLPVSVLEGVTPKLPESLSALAAIQRAGIPPRMAVQPLVAALQAIEKADEV